MTTLFISDLHLDAERPRITDLFARFVREEARRADALYILGDLFEAWVGDDDPSEAGAVVARELSALQASGVPVYFIRGNRDFLVGNDFARRAGLRILPDPSVVHDPASAPPSRAVAVYPVRGSPPSVSGGFHVTCAD